MAGAPPTLNGEVVSASGSGLATTTFTITLTADVVGNLLVGGISTTGAAVSSIADSRGNAWAVVATGTNGARLNPVVGRMDRKLKAGDYLTVTCAGAISAWAASLLDYSNAHLTSTTTDASVGTTGTSSAPNSGATGATTVNDEIVVGMTQLTGAPSDYSSAGAGYTQRGTKTTDGTTTVVLEDKTVSATGAQTTAATLGSSKAWVQYAVCIRGSKYWYVDFSKADNTGDGLAFATAKKDVSAVTTKSGDQIHIAKSADPTAQTGTMTFTDNSTSVATSADLTATLAAKDMIGPYTGSDVLGGDGWWEISSLTSTTITLVLAYSGTTRTTVTGYLYDGSDTTTGFGTTLNTAGAFGTQASPTLVIGGYDTSNDTRTGMSHYRCSNATKAGTIAPGGQFHYYSYIGVSRGIGWNVANANCRVDHCFTASGNGTALNANNTQNLVFDTCYVFKTTNTPTNCITSSNSSGTVISNCVVQAGTSGVNCIGTSNHTLVDTCTLRRGNSFGISLLGRFVTVRNCTINNCASAGISFSNSSGAAVVSGGTYSSNGTDFSGTGGSVNGMEPNYIFNAATSSTTSFNRSAGTVFYIDRINQAAGTWKSLLDDGNILSNTANARSNTCVELQPNATANFGDYLEWSTPIPVDATGTRTVTVYVAKSASWNGNTCNIGLRLNGYWTTTTGLASPNPSTGLATTYTAYTFVFAMTEIGAIDFCLQVDGNAGSIYVDDLAWT